MSKTIHYDVSHEAGSNVPGCSVNLSIAADAIASACTEGLLYLDASAGNDYVLATPVADYKSVHRK